VTGASARTRVLNTESESFPTAAAIAAVLIDNAIPTPARAMLGVPLTASRHENETAGNEEY
jgi:hypothetical protein